MDTQKWKRKKEKALRERNLDHYFYACKELAGIYFHEEKYNEALSEYKEMAQTSETLGKKIDVARAHRMIGEVYSEIGNFKNAIKHELIYLGLSRDEGDEVEQQRALATLGRTYFLRSETEEEDSLERRETLEKAKEYYLKSLSLCDTMSDGLVGNNQKMEMRARLFLNLGLVHESKSNYEDAVKNMTKAITICKNLDLWEDLYRTYMALAGCHARKEGQMDQALKTCDLALDAASRLPNKVELMSDVLLLKADFLLQLPDFRGARQALIKAYKIKSPTHNKKKIIEKKLRIVAEMCECEDKLIDLPQDSNNERKTIYERIGDMASELNNFSLAVIYYKLMLECVEAQGLKGKPLIDSYVSLAQTYKDNKDYSLAVEYFKKELELELENPSEACKTSLNIAELLQMLKRYGEMTQMYDKARQFSLKTSNLKLRHTALVLMARALRVVEEKSPAEVSYPLSEIERQIEDPCFNNLSDSESEDEETKVEIYGEHIDLEELTDLDDNEDLPEDCNRRKSRQRTKRQYLHKRNEKGETPLHRACISGNVGLVQKLIDQGHCLDVKDYSGWTPLHEACNHGYKEIVEILITKGANVNDRGGALCNGVTPLLDAASNGCLDIVELLLEKGASPLMKTNKGETVLDCLVEWRERYKKDVGSDLFSSALVQYSAIYSKLEDALKKAGLKVKDKAPEKLLSLRTPSTSDLSQGRKEGERRRSNEDGPSEKLRSLRTPSTSDLSQERKEGKRRRSSEDGASEYKNVINALKHRHKADKVALHVERTISQPALLTESETVDDDWLDDDLNITGLKRKRKTEQQFVGEPMRRTKEVKMSDTVSRPCFVGKKNEELLLTFENDYQITRKNQTISSSDDSDFELTTQRRCKAPLKEDDVPEEAQEVKVTSQTAQKSAHPLMSVKIRVEGKLLLVPIENQDTANIGWLAQEAAKRYLSLEGIEPVLRLSTEDGALLVDSDPVSLVLDSKELHGYVRAWKKIPIFERYKSACSESHTSVDPHLTSVLKMSEVTGTASIADLFVSSEAFYPFMKTIAHPCFIQNLILHGNNIGDEGLKAVAEFIARMKTLKSLDLSCTNITDEGLRYLSQAAVEHNGLQSLHTLDLGFNILGRCLQSLGDILNLTNCLKHLGISGANLTMSTFRNVPLFPLDTLESLDVSFNEINGVGLSEILKRLDGQTIKSLKLGSTGSSIFREVGIFLEHHQSASLTHLDLSYCHVVEEEIPIFIKGLKATSGLTSVALIGVKNASSLIIDGNSLTDVFLAGASLNPSCDLAMARLVISSDDSLAPPEGSCRGPNRFRSSTSKFPFM